MSLRWPTAGWKNAKPTANPNIVSVCRRLTKKCPVCGKYLLDVNGKKGKMLICQDRECGYRKGLTQVTNARCPECHKKMELRGEGDKKMVTCVCGYRERLSDFNKRREDKGAGKADVMSYMRKQQKEQQKDTANNPFADLLKNWNK